MADELIPSEATPQRDLHWVFIGSNGLRPGWSALLFLAIFLGLGFGSSVVLRLVHASGNGTSGLSPSHAAMGEALLAALVLCATFLMSRIENRPFSVYGYGGKAKLVRFVSGGFFGFLAISALVCALWKAQLLVFDGHPLHGYVAWKYAAEWGLVFLFTGIFEESLLRGFLQYTVARGIGFWWAALLLSALFGFIHKNNPGESPVGLVSAAVIGLVFCLSLWYTGSLWWAIGFHATWDWGETYFYGTPDSGMVGQGSLLSEHPIGSLLWSGGTTGPEGSLLVLPLVLLLAVAMWLWWGRKTAN